MAVIIGAREKLAILILRPFRIHAVGKTTTALLLSELFTRAGASVLINQPSAMTAVSCRQKDPEGLASSFRQALLFLSRAHKRSPANRRPYQTRNSPSRRWSQSQSDPPADHNRHTSPPARK